MSSQTFLKTQLTKLEANINAYQDAILALVSTGVFQYTLNTGQTIDTVTKIDVIRLQSQLDDMLNLYDRLCVRVGVKSNVVYMRPAY